ncbi:hypothetical protein [Kitasatospora sp. NPDC005751]|uniref:hypothetical protein n=1 Tax=unclassified Kitasatospora TaxID=2633591 RepID=UPI0033FD50DF
MTDVHPSPVVEGPAPALLDPAVGPRAPGGDRKALGGGDFGVVADTVFGLFVPAPRTEPPRCGSCRP